MNDLEFISDVIYHLKREYGESAEIGRETTNVDTVTGNKNRTIVASVNVPRVILLPLSWRKFFGQKEAGVVEVGIQEILIDQKDTKSFIPQFADYIKTAGVTRDIKKVDTYAGRAYVIQVAAIDGMANVRP